ncbi:MAG: Maf family protein [Phycisphaerales bacterium]|nr:Maf family protein [Phycisphaerales bacterium]
MVNLVLGSQSPRRLQLLREHGFEPRVILPLIDDGVFDIGAMLPSKWVETLAVLKAIDVAEQCAQEDVVIAADTVCVLHNHVFGQPKEGQDARDMLRAMTNREHHVYTGWCIATQDGHLESGCDIASIYIGDLSEQSIDTYIQSEHWKGKAGGYNVLEQIEAGWPISVEGDMTGVMGLPMQVLEPLLSKFLKTQ